MKNSLNLTLLVMLSLALTATTAPAGTPAQASPEQAAPLHATFDRLLDTYVRDGAVDYKAWSGSDVDKAALGDYVEQLTELDPEQWPAHDALAYWINLYNAATLRLVLGNYPLASIKDLGGFLKTSPWERKVVIVGGRELTLNEIENKIIRPTFADPRIHFALNCASMGCPPLAAEAYIPARLGEQLDTACRTALNRDQWVRVDGETIMLTKIFDWYGDDFRANGGTVLGFVRRYHDGSLPKGDPKIQFMSYDWSLNQTPGESR